MHCNKANCINRARTKYFDIAYTKKKILIILQEMHEGVGGVHFLVDITIPKKFPIKYWWPTFHKDVMDHCKSCDNSQRTGNLVHINLVKLITMFPIEPFTKWGIHFIGPIKPT